jgi:hypothetical protein
MERGTASSTTGVFARAVSTTEVVVTARGRRASRWAAPGGCISSALVHGLGLALVFTLGHPPVIAARFEVMPVTVIAEEPEGTGLATAMPVPPPEVARHRPLSHLRPPTHREPRLSDRPGHVSSPAPPPPAALAPPPAPPLAAPVAPPPSVSPAVAQALRVSDDFPSLPDETVRSRPDLDVQVCVSAEGSVSEAVILSGPTDPAAARLRAAILAWRYRPYTPGGRPAPFCHLLRISYRTN